MDPFPRPQRLAAFRQKLAALTTELVKTEEELTTLEADGQLNLGAPVGSKKSGGLPVIEFQQAAEALARADFTR